MWTLTVPGAAVLAPPVMRTIVVGIHLKMVAVLFHLPCTQYMPAEKHGNKKFLVLASAMSSSALALNQK
jgi:hypothetical protein